jgi:hypothetical protein
VATTNGSGAAGSVHDARLLSEIASDSPVKGHILTMRKHGITGFAGFLTTEFRDRRPMMSKWKIRTALTGGALALSAVFPSPAETV